MGPQIGRNTERPEQLSIAISSYCKTLPLKLSCIWWLCRFVFKFKLRSSQEKKSTEINCFFFFFKFDL